jgi:transporter family protein
MQLNWVILAVLSAVSAAFVAIFGKIGIKNVDTITATTARAIVMALVLVVVSIVLGKVKLVGEIQNKALAFIVLSGLAGALSWVFYFLALKRGPAAGVAALDRTSVVFVLVLAFIFLAEKITWKSALGAGLLTVGAILMAM